MPSYATVTLSGMFTLPDGSPDTGSVFIRAMSDPVLDAGDNVVLSGLLEVHLDIAGKFTVILPASDDPALSPTNFGYKAWYRLDGAGNSPYYHFALPAATPNVDFSDIVPVSPSTFDPDADYALESDLLGHENNHSNPHAVTKAQIGLGNVDNTSDMDKPISTAVAAALAAIDSGGAATSTMYFPEAPAYGAVGDGTTDDTAALQACIDAAAANGGGLCMFLGRYGWSGDLLIKGGVTVIGSGGPQLRTAGFLAAGELGLKALDSTARVRWGQLNDGSNSANDNPGPLMNITIDGQGVGGTGELLRAEAIETSMFNVHVINGVGNGVNWTQSQNVNTMNLTIGGFPNGCADLLEAGTAGLQPPGHIIQYGGHVGDSKLCYRSTSPDASFFVGPHDNKFYGTIFETGRTAGLAIDGVGEVLDGDLELIGCVHTIGSQVTAINNDATILVANDIHTTITTTLTLNDCTLGGGSGAVKATDAVRNKGDLTHVSNTVNYISRTQVANVTYMHCNDTADGIITVEGTVVKVTAITDYFRVANSGTLAGIRADRITPIRFLARGDTGTPFQIRRDTDTVANRLQITRDGLIQWLDGAAGAVRGSLSRSSTDNQMAMQGRWNFVDGLARSIDTVLLSVDAAATIDASLQNVVVWSFLSNGVDITSVTISNPVEGNELEIGIFGTGTNTITWPASSVIDFTIAPGGIGPQPVSGQMHWLKLRYFNGKWWFVAYA